MTFRVRRWWRLLGVVSGVVALAGVATAHEGGELLFDGRPVGLAAVVGGSVLVCLTCGLVAPARRSWFDRDARLPLHSVTGLLFVVLGLSLLLPAFVAAPSLAALGALSAGLVVGGLERRSTEAAHHTHLSVGAVLAHRVVEGGLLAAVYAADVAVGLLGAVALTLHALAETVAVGWRYADRPPLALRAVVLVQVAFVAGVSLGQVTTTVLPEVTTHLVMAAAGVVLLFTGVSETTARHPRH